MNAHRFSHLFTALFTALFGGALLVTALVISLSLAHTSAQATVAATNVAPPGNTMRIYGFEPATIDPALPSYVQEVRIIGQVFEGLVRLDENFQPQPALANAWTHSPDASVFTFTLREAYFSNGRRVVAADVVNSIMRALSPTIDNGSRAAYASMLYDIQGASAYNGGNTSVAVGVQALDSTTVRFDLVGTVAPDLFLKKLSLWIASIVPIEEINAGGTQWWRDPAHYVGTGPFKMTEWITGDHISLAPNSMHYGGPPPLSGLTVRFFTDTDTALDAYRANQLDIMEPSAAQGSTIKNDPILSRDFITGSGICTFWSTLDNQKAPFSGTSGLKLRQAFNYAVDRTAFVSATMGGAALPAKGIIPPSNYGYNPALQGLDYNVVSATQRYAESGYNGTPQIVFYASQQQLPRAQYLSNQLSNTLGVNIVITTSSTENYQMRIAGWCADYPDPENWLPPLLRSNSGINRTHYNNPTFDALVDQAARTITESERVALYQQAEQLAVSEAAVLPLYHTRLALLKKPWVLGPIAFDWQWNHSFDNVSIVSSATITPGTSVTITADANVSLQFPANAFAQPAVITYSAVAALPTGLSGNLMGTGYTFVLTGAYAGSGSMLGLFQSPVTLTIQYTLPGAMRENTLALYTWNGNAWAAADTCGGPWINTAAHVYQVALCHFSEYALVGQTYRIYLPLTIRN